MIVNCLAACWRVETHIVTMCVNPVVLLCRFDRCAS